MEKREKEKKNNSFGAILDDSKLLSMIMRKPFFITLKINYLNLAVISSKKQ